MNRKVLTKTFMMISTTLFSMVCIVIFQRFKSLVLHLKLLLTCALRHEHGFVVLHGRGHAFQGVRHDPEPVLASCQQIRYGVPGGGGGQGSHVLPAGGRLLSPLYDVAAQTGVSLHWMGVP